VYITPLYKDNVNFKTKEFLGAGVVLLALQVNLDRSQVKGIIQQVEM